MEMTLYVSTDFPSVFCFPLLLPYREEVGIHRKDALYGETSFLDLQMLLLDVQLFDVSHVDRKGDRVHGLTRFVVDRDDVFPR